MRDEMRGLLLPEICADILIFKYEISDFTVITLCSAKVIQFSLLKFSRVKCSIISLYSDKENRQ